MRQLRDPFKKIEGQIQTETETRVREQEQIVSSIPTKTSQLENDVFFNKNGVITGRMATFIDVFETNSEGVFTADFSMVGFKEPPKVTVSTETQAPVSDYASIFKDSVTTIGCSGRVSSAGAGVKVTVEAKGII